MYSVPTVITEGVGKEDRVQEENVRRAKQLLYFGSRPLLSSTVTVVRLSVNGCRELNWPEEEWGEEKRGIVAAWCWNVAVSG